MLTTLKELKHSILKYLVGHLQIMRQLIHHFQIAV